MFLNLHWVQIITSIVQKPASWYAQNDMRFMAGVRVSQINRAQKIVVCDNGEQVAYDHLIMATGSRPAKIPAKNQENNKQSNDFAGGIAQKTKNESALITEKNNLISADKALKKSPKKIHTTEA